MIVALAGGVGGAKLAQGLAAVVSDSLTVVVNTGDDFDLYGLRICPDLDTVLYTLAGIADPVQGWGVAGDTTATLDAIARLGRDPWFKLGDRDFATHIVRTERLRAGAPLSVVTGELATALGVRATILPMTDDPVATLVQTPGGTLPFQDYFVLRRQTDEVTGVTFAGIDQAAPAPGLLDAIRQAEAIVFCPSNPFVSIGPILAVPGVAAASAASPAPVVAVSPIVGGQAIKGPAAKMFASLGMEPSALAVARRYVGQIDGLAIDEVDAALAPAIEALGIRPLVTRTVMGGFDDRARLATETLAFARGLTPVESGA
ncbi:MAG TPA: 2-phospho-L-lactate transferase [Thermomicrobiales bacterium]|nr:2-phospho-L-lactate transferase [Thermomicrobiales bacterium]